MIIFTVTSNITGQVYVGSTRNDLESQWEKMVAAAQQDLDYPLYREIRINGEDAFTVEEWDRAENRQELQDLEQEALDHFGAKSLRGYKTSTVKILPKKKTRQRKSSIERELAAIFSSETSDNETPPSLAIKSTDSVAQTQVAPLAQAAPPTPASQSAAEPTITKESIKAALAKIAAEEKAKAEAEAEQEKVVQLQTTVGSQANAMVQMKSIDLSDDINVQLAAITTAADAVLSGDNSAASELQAIPEAQKPEQPEIEAEIAPQPEAASVVEKVEEIAKPVCPKELRIREAIERHRQFRAQKSQESMDQERRQIAALLADLDVRAKSLHTGVLAAVA